MRKNHGISPVAFHRAHLIQVLYDELPKTALALAADSTIDWDPENPFTAEYKCLWCSFPRPSDSGQSFETHGKGRSVMYVTRHDYGWIFLYERLSQPTNERISYTDNEIDALAAIFSDYTVADGMKVRDAYAKRLNSGLANLEEGILEHWNWGRIVLAGDACHKYTPNAGLGLNHGIQDIVVLCNGLRKATKDAPVGLDTATLRRV
ncbi:hypothetical protein BBP40_008152 [Aspergillus hancockii]|nr:hypothetical protein BBP40_008152 [Aspergillus hancockii]